MGNKEIVNKPIIDLLSRLFYKFKEIRTKY